MDFGDPNLRSALDHLANLIFEELDPLKLGNCGVTLIMHFMILSLVYFGSIISSMVSQ
jgi:hypothetical protein